MWAMSLAGVAAAAATAALGFMNDDLRDVGIRIFLNDWLTLNFVLTGLVAWWRRPDSRFGPLMVLAGFANFVSTLSWANADVPYTIGFALGLVAPLLFLHVFLAYPSGRLVGRLEQAIVGGAYATGIGLDLVRMLLRGGAWGRQRYRANVGLHFREPVYTSGMPPHRPSAGVARAAAVSRRATSVAPPPAPIPAGHEHRPHRSHLLATETDPT